VLEIIFIFIIVILAFAGVIWFAIRSTQKTKQQSINKQQSRMEPDLSESDAFSTVLNQQMTQHTITTESDDGVNVSLSSQANTTVDTTTSKTTEQTEIDFKLNDDIDLDIDIHSETEPTMEIVDDWDMVIAFTIMAKEGKIISGEDLKWALESEQFQYGDMQIFHRLTPQGKPLFSVANILDPGIFNLANIATITTPGILIFAKLPGPINGLTLFDDLLETARTLTNKLSGLLCDDARQPVTNETIEAMRSRILNLNFSLHSENQEPHVYTD
jgi:cell division protein ZipA